MKNVKYVPRLYFIFLASTRHSKIDSNQSMMAFHLHQAKGPVSLCFDRMIPTTIGFITGVKMSAIHAETTFNDILNATYNNSYDINQPHKVFGHCGFETLRNTAKICNLITFRNSGVCKECVL
jgi:hypothetical protein